MNTIQRILKYGALFFAAIILQSTAIDIVSIGGHRPDLILILVIVIAIKEGSLAGLISGFIFGVLQDSHNPTIMGTHALAKTLAGFFLGFFNEKTVKTIYPIKLLLVLAAFVVHELTVCVCTHTLHNFLRISMPMVLYSLIVTAVIMYVEENLDRKS